MDTSAFPLVAASKLCLVALNSLSSSLEAAGNEHTSLMSPQTLRNQRDRFKIWAGNLGALQEGRASLDFRLRESILMQSAVHKLLKQLEDTIKRSSDVVLGVRKPLEESLASTDEEKDLWGDSSDDDSSSDEKEGINTRTELGQNTVAIIQILSDLYKLSFKIRNPATRSNALKPLLFKQMVHVDGTTLDLLAHFAPFDRNHVEEELRELRRSVQGRPRLKDVYPAPECLDDINTDEANPQPLPTSDDLGVEPEEGPRNFLVERWGKSLTNRRRFFAYWEKHAQKLSKIRSDHVDSERPEHIGAQTPAPKPAPGPTAVLAAPAAARPSLAGKTILSGTEGSTYDRRLDDETDSHSVVSYASTTYDIDGTAADLPRPPQVKPSQKEFQCPYCWVTCPARHAKGKPWREHLLRDLQPYMCTYENCSDPDAMYASRQAWMAHEADAHRRVWRCFAHAEPLYSSQGALEQHLVAEHGAELGPAQIQQLSKRSHANTVDQRSTCPFCQSTGPFKKGLSNHMAFHMEQLACFALPRSSCTADDASSGGKNTNTAQAARSDASLASVSLVFSDTSSVNGDEIASHTGPVRSVAFSPDGKTLASASDDTSVLLWHVETGALQKTLEGHSMHVNSVAFSPDGKTLASASADRSIRLWNETGACYQILNGHRDPVTAVAFSPDGMTLASASWDKTIRLWDKTGACYQILNGHRDPVTAVAFSPDGMTLASASWDKTIRLWDKTGACYQILQDHSDWVNAVAFSPDGMTLASASNDCSIQLCHLKTGAYGGVFTIDNTTRVADVAFSPDGTTLASPSSDSTAKLWDLKTGQHQQTLEGHSMHVNSVAFSPDGKTLESASADRSIRLWDGTDACYRTLDGHSDWVMSVTFSPDGKILASASLDWMVKMWDPDSGECLRTLGLSDIPMISMLLISIYKALSAAQKDYRTVKNDDTLPDAFHEAGRALAVVSEGLDTVKTTLKDDRPEFSELIAKRLYTLRTKATLSQKILRRVASAPETSRPEEYGKAVINERGGRRVEILIKEMMEVICLLGRDHTLKTIMEPDVERLRAAIRGLSAMKSSLPDESV